MGRSTGEKVSAEIGLLHNFIGIVLLVFGVKNGRLCFTEDYIVDVAYRYSCKMLPGKRRFSSQGV